MKRLLAILVSIRTTAVLMLLVALMLFAGVIVPQRAVAGDAVLNGIAHSSSARAFVIETLGLGNVATSPLFIAALALFYINLIAVLLHRTPAMLGRMRLRKPSPEALAKWVASPRAIARTSQRTIEALPVVTTLRGFGFRPQRVTATSLYAVKHRYAAVGFLLFHLSFFFLCAGGLLIWYTRWVGELRVVEGQSADAQSTRVLRHRPIGGTPELSFTLDRMEPSFDRGEATDLRATVRFTDAPPVDAWVNHPARRGAESLLVSDVGIAPVLWLQDSRGFGIDRVAVPADRINPVDVPLAGGIVRVRVLPAAQRPAVPSRAALGTFPIDLVVSEGTGEVFRGTLRPGEAATFPGGRIVLTEIRYWGGVKLVSERGGALLMLGFALITTGATWRLLMHRRDLVVEWSEQSFRLAGHGEWFADRDRRELEDVANAIVRAAESKGAAAKSLSEIEVSV